MSKQYITFYFIGLFNLILWFFLFFIYLPLFQGNSYVFQLNTTLFSGNGVSSDGLNSQIQVNPLLLFLCCFLFSLVMLVLKFYLLDRTLLLLLVSLFNLIFSFGGLVSSPSLISKIKTLSLSLSDQASLGWFNLLSIQYNRTPEETWERICSYLKTENRYSILLEKDKEDLYNYIITFKPNMLNVLSYLDLLYKKRESIAVSHIESNIKVNSSIGFFDLLYPYFTSDSYYIGWVCTALLGCGLGFLVVSLNSNNSISSRLDSLTTEFNELSQQVKKNTIPVIGDADDADPVEVEQRIREKHLYIVDAEHIRDTFDNVSQSIVNLTRRLAFLESLRHTSKSELSKLEKDVYTLSSEIMTLSKYMEHHQKHTSSLFRTLANDAKISSSNIEHVTKNVASLQTKVSNLDSMATSTFLEDKVHSILSKLKDVS